MYEYKVVVTKVKDGDTIVGTISLGCGSYFKPWGGIRLNGVNTPEIHDKDPALQKRAKAAMDFVAGRLKPGADDAPEIKVVTYKADADNVLDKYGRLLADVFYLPPAPPKTKKKAAPAPEPTWRNLNKELIEAGHAKPYSGEGEKPV